MLRNSRGGSAGVAICCRAVILAKGRGPLVPSGQVVADKWELKMKHVHAVFLVATLAMGCGTGTESTKAAENCAENNLIAQCPPNTTPDLSADATSSCDTAGSVDLNMGAETSSGSASVTQGCVGTGSCRIVCKFESPCMYGVESIHPTEGIRCGGPPAACGNRVCEAGETPESCANDCAGECEPGSTRCEGDAVATCTPQAAWGEAVACGSGQVCSTMADGAACVDQEAMGGSGGMGGAGGEAGADGSVGQGGAEGGAGGEGGVGGEGGAGGAAGAGGAGGAAGAGGVGGMLPPDGNGGRGGMRGDQSAEGRCESVYIPLFTMTCAGLTIEVQSEDNGQIYVLGRASAEDVCAVSDLAEFIVCVHDRIESGVADCSTAPPQCGGS